MMRAKVNPQTDPLQAVDAILAAGPQAAAVDAAQARLRAALRAHAPQVYYDILPRSPIGRVCIAASERGVIALDFGLDEGEFVRRLEHRTRAGVRRSSERVQPAVRQVQEYLSGARTSFDLPLDLTWISAFQQQVLPRGAGDPAWPNADLPPGGRNDRPPPGGPGRRPGAGAQPGPDHHPVPSRARLGWLAARVLRGRWTAHQGLAAAAGRRCPAAGIRIPLEKERTRTNRY